MTLIQGSLTLRRFLVMGPVPSAEELQAGLQQDMFRPFQDGLEEERMGWCDWRNPLITPPEADWSSLDRYALFGLRLDSRKVPPSLLKAHVDLRLRQLQAEKDLAFIGKEWASALAAPGNQDGCNGTTRATSPSPCPLPLGCLSR